MKRYDLSVIGGGSGGLTVAAIAKKYGLQLTTLSHALHVYVTLSEVCQALGDAYLLQRVTPRARKFLSPVFTWLRRGLR
jgi:flavin-dependent dehydrogenase